MKRVLEAHSTLEDEKVINTMPRVNKKIVSNDNATSASDAENEASANPPTIRATSPPPKGRRHAKPAPAPVDEEVVEETEVTETSEQDEVHVEEVPQPKAKRGGRKPKAPAEPEASEADASEVEEKPRGKKAARAHVPASTSDDVAADEDAASEGASEGGSSSGPRGKKRVTFTEFMNDFDVLLEYIDKKMGTNSKNTDKAGSNGALRTIRNKVEALSKRVRWLQRGKPRAPRPPAEDGDAPRANPLAKPVKITPELAKFLGVSAKTEIPRMEIMNALGVYCFLKDGEDRESMLKWKNLNKPPRRDIRDPAKKSVINLDDSLKKLLKYDKYVADVEAGRVTSTRVNRRTGERELVTVTDPVITRTTLQRLIGTHIVKSESR